MNEFNRDKLQAVLDNYSVGKITAFYMLASVSVNEDKEIIISKCLVETNQGVFIIAYAPNDDLHDLWWSSDSSDFAAKISKALKLKNAKLLLTNQNSNTVHKFDLRITVFTL